jgi:hypothetical protein
VLSTTYDLTEKKKATTNAAKGKNAISKGMQFIKGKALQGISKRERSKEY